MIDSETIDKIFEAAKIEEVIGDFVELKKEVSTILEDALSIMKRHHHLQFHLLKGFTSALAVAKEGML